MGVSIYLGHIKGENNNEGNMEWIVMRQNTKHIKEKKITLVSMVCSDCSRKYCIYFFIKFNCCVAVAEETSLGF